jgi:predicted transcriptional regulator of viral defense system
VKQLEAITALRALDQAGRYVFSKAELRNLLFYAETKASFERSLERLVAAGVLERAARGVYVNPHANSYDGYVIEHIAKALRPGEYNYVSLESALSEYGVISQVLVDRLTVVTTGRKGEIHTPFGVIEFTHTAKPRSKIIGQIKRVPDRPLRIASKEYAWKELKRVGRNTNMVNQEVLNNG